MEKIGVIGGTFDPVHIGHLMLADQAASYCNLTKILFVPSGLPPHKDKTKITAAAHRIEMVRLAIGTDDLYGVSTIECDNYGVSYTYITLEKFRGIYGRDAELYYIIGSDVLKYITKFRNCRQIFDSCILLAATRPGFDQKATESLAGELVDAYGARIEIFNFPEIGISSSLLRSKIAGGESVRYMLPDSVIEYIKRNGLYAVGEETVLPGYWESIPEPVEPAPQSCDGGGRDDHTRIGRIKRIVASRLSINRFRHTLRVMETAGRLADLLGADREKAVAAGLLHDCMREVPFEELINICESGGLRVTEEDRLVPVVLHAPAASIEAGKLLGGVGADITEAIACHTTGRDGMGLLAKILFVADAIEPERDYEAARVARLMLDADHANAIDEAQLNAAVLFLLEKQIEHIKENGRVIHPDTLRARNWLYGNVAKGTGKNG